MQAEAFDITTTENNLFRPNFSVLDTLRRQILQIERGDHSRNILPTKNEPTISLGDSKIDAALPWGGLPLAGLHEVFGDIAAVGFSAMLLNKIINENLDAPILWCQHKRDLCGHGLAEFGIDPGRLIFVHGKNDADILWAMEEGLRSSNIAAVVGKPYKIPPIAGRRLQLVAEKNNIPSIIIRPQNHNKGQQDVTPTSSALTRWRVTSAPSITPANGHGLGAPKWNLELQRCRYSALNLQMQSQKQIAGRKTSWQVEWCYEKGDLSVVSDISNGSAKLYQN